MSASVLQHCATAQKQVKLIVLGRDSCSGRQGTKVLIRSNAVYGAMLVSQAWCAQSERDTRTRGQVSRVSQDRAPKKEHRRGLTSDLKPSSVVVVPSCSSSSSAAVQYGSVSNLVGSAWIQGYHLDF